MAASGSAALPCQPAGECLCLSVSIHEAFQAENTIPHCAACSCTVHRSASASRQHLGCHFRANRQVWPCFRVCTRCSTSNGSAPWCSCCPLHRLRPALSCANIVLHLATDLWAQHILILAHYNRAGEAPSTGLTEALVGLGFETDRLKTGTPARVDSRTVDYTGLEAQPGDPDVRWFSFDSSVCSLTLL